MKRITLSFLVASVTSFLLVVQYQYYTSNIRSAPRNVQFKNILYWTKMFDRTDFYLGVGSKIFEQCEVKNCYATSDKSYLPVDEFDAIIFHGNEHLTEDKLPVNRSQNQYYIYSNQESPAYTTTWFEPQWFFNWTMTYRSDSDIIRPYGYYEKMPTDYRMPTVEEVQNKSHKIAWMVSNCYASSLRTELYVKINKYIPVDVYGDCGKKSCPKEKSDFCYDVLAKNYKFYLSFENSICSEYVTEKLYAALMRDVVPIVYGGADYTKIAPPHSVIDVTKFDSVKLLVDYIQTLDEHPEKYLSYFEWKKDYVIRRDNIPTLCNLCKKLNEPIIGDKAYNSITEWWGTGMCKFENELPKILFQ